MSDVQHQPRAMRTLQRALQGRRTPHAYLFTGPEGVGREMMAVGLAQTLLCESPGSDSQAPLLIESTVGDRGSEPQVDACSACTDCQLVQADTHPDLSVIYRQLSHQHPESRIRGQKAIIISVDVIRHFLVDRTGTRPNRGRARVFIVREAERMNDAAQNALLKTLEEPPHATFLILSCTSPDRMLPTIRSRCQQVRFQLLPVQFVIERLQSLRPETPDAERQYVARHTGGSLGAALRQIDDGLYPIKQAWGERLAQLAVPPRGFAPHALSRPMQADAQTLGKALAARDPDISDTDATRAGLHLLLAILADFYSDALRTATNSKLPLVNADQLEVINRLVATRRPGSLSLAARTLAEAEANLARNANIELTLETLFIHLAPPAARASA